MLKLLLISLSMLLNLFGDPVEEMFLYNDATTRIEAQPLFVSLGSTCHVAIALRALGLRDAAYPFDWVITSHLQPITSIIDDDFQHFTDPDHFVLRKGVPAYINTFYSLGFPHDFKAEEQITSSIDALTDWMSFKERYDRRVERFRSLRDYPGKVYFLRTMWGNLFEGANGEFNENNSRTQLLRDTLKRYFPNLDFTLVIVSHPDLNIPPIENIPDVVELKINRGHAELKEGLMALAFPPAEQPVEERLLEAEIPLETPRLEVFFKARLVSSPFTGICIQEKAGALHFSITFKRHDKIAALRLEQLGLHRKSRKDRFFETTDRNEQLALLQLALQELLIPLEDYHRLYNKLCPPPSF